MKDIEDKIIKLFNENIPEDKLIEFQILKEVGNKEKTQGLVKSILPDIETILDNNLKKLLIDRTNRDDLLL